VVHLLSLLLYQCQLLVHLAMRIKKLRKVATAYETVIKSYRATYRSGRE
jgi:hypothetical protein